MRLLYWEQHGELVLTHEYKEEAIIPPYAVLSHTWLTEEEEVLFQDVKDGSAQRKPASFNKIRFCGEQARKDGLRYFWVDTCCIDKSSSQEVSEAVTTMFKWYRKAARCYVYLADVFVETQEHGRDPTSRRSSQTHWRAAFRSSRWFTRGWTLQELLAPKDVEFFSAEGISLGNKTSLERALHEVTGIPCQALHGTSLDTFSVDERISWSDTRQTSRTEDKAYSLLGILNISMSLRYGEQEHASIRLREKVEKLRSRRASLLHPSSQLPVAHAAAFNSRENDHGPTCLEGTRVELLEDISTWIRDPDSPCLFWLSGIAGTGKTTVSRTVARMYHNRSLHESQVLAGSFFFSTRGEKVGVADRFFTTLAHQMATRIPVTHPHIASALDDDPEIAERSLGDQWDQLIVKPLSKLEVGPDGPRTLLFVVDALNECGSERDIQAILGLLKTSNKIAKVRVRILITSRPETPVRHGFSRISESERKTLILQDIPRTMVDRDLTLYFEHEFSTIRTERNLPTDWPGEPASKRLVELSCGLFLWASTACRFIHRAKFVRQRISRLLDDHDTSTDPEKQLDEIYTAVLKDSIEPDCPEEERQSLYTTMRQVIGGIVILDYPLSRNALAELLSIPPNEIDETLADLHTVLSVPEKNDRPLRLHHPTFREFILNQNRCSDLKLWVNEEQAHLSMANNCLKVMTKGLKKNICELESSGTTMNLIPSERIKKCIPAELTYACLYWIQHFRRGGKQLHAGDRTHRFFEKNFLFWMEVMVLIGKSSEIATLMRMYASLIQPQQDKRHIPFIKDARQFFFASQSIIEHAPLQIYCAALMFTRSSNQLRNYFWGQLHPFLRKAQIIAGNAPGAKEEYNYVNDVAFTPDGTRLASGSTNECVRLWDVQTKAALSKYDGQTEKSSAVAVSADGVLLASGSDDCTVMVWDIKSRKRRCVLSGHSRWVNAVAFSFDGKLLASGSMDETVRVWDLASAKELRCLEPNLSCINAVAFSPDCSLLAIGTADRLIEVWDLDEDKTLHMLDGHLGPVNSVHFSPDGSRIASGSDDLTIKLWDADTGTVVKSIAGHSKRIWAVGWSGDGKIIASGSEDKTVKLWDAETLDPRFELPGHTSGVNAVSISPVNPIVASASFDDEVRLWDTQTGASLGKFADFEEDTRPFAVNGINGGDSAPRGHEKTIDCLAFSADGRTVASGSRDFSIKLWKREGVEQHELNGHEGGISSITFSHDRWLASSANDRTVRIWNASTGTLRHTLDHPSEAINRVQFSKDGKLLATYSADNDIRLWRVENGKLQAVLSGHEGIVEDVAFSPVDSDILASCSADSTLRLWSISSGTLLSVFRGHSKAVNSVAFAPDGETLCSCSADNTVMLWNTDGARTGRIVGHTAAVSDASFSADGKTLVSSGEDKTIRIWDVETEAVCFTLNCRIAVRQVRFSQCGQYIETDRGLLDFDTQDQKLKFNLFAGPDRVRAKGGDDVLSLPEEYRPTSVAACNGTVVLGHPNGGLSFMYS